MMLLDVLAAFKKAGLLNMSYVVTSDAAALGRAKGAGALIVEEPRDEGVNAAVLAGMNARGRDADFMVVPSDLPSLTADEIETALRLKRTFDCVLSPSRSFDGTNLLLFSPESMPALSYDSDSFWNHVRGAATKGITLAVCCGEGIMSDVDTPEDLRALSVSRRKTPSREFAREALKTRPS